MSDDIQITNCHIHTFLDDHVPPSYPFWWARPFKVFPKLLLFLSRVFGLIGQLPTSENLYRLYAFQKESQHHEQARLLENVRKHYPSNTRFVVLPMELSGIGYGAPPVPLRRQHDELAQLAAAEGNEGKVLPFATLDPRIDVFANELWRAIDKLGFHGIKLYPRLGYSPTDQRLIDHVYPKANTTERHGRMGLPIMAHCSRGGVQDNRIFNSKADKFTEPKAFLPILKDFPNLRMCLAHFGGQRDWLAYVDPDKSDLPKGAVNWQTSIRELIGSGHHPGLWTDISYTLFEFEEFIPFLRLFLLGDDDSSERLRQRVLFGSDFYMTRQEALSEKAVCFRLRNALGEDVFRRIAEENPAVWLGERNARPYPPPKAV